MNTNKSVRSRLKTLVLMSVCLVALIVGAISIIICSVVVNGNYRKIAETSTIHLKQALENGDRTWSYDEENDVLVCGGREVTVDLFKAINNDDETVFHTVFWDDTRVLTNIKNEKGAFAVGTQADEAIYKSVKSGDTFVKNGVEIFGDKYTVCYLPIYNGEDFCGMLFTGIEQSAVNNVLWSMVLVILAGAVVIFVLMLIIANKQLSDISETLSGKLNAGYNELLDFSGKVREISERTNTGVSEIADAMDNVADGATGQAQATEEAMASTEEFTASIDVVNLEIGESFNNIETIRTCVHASENSIEELNESIDVNNRIVEDISIDIDNGVERTTKAKTIIKTINNLASQINLLALNASVEASHAGSYGKGFAVVADEIKKLALSSSKSASDTSDIIADIVDTMTKTKESNELLVESNRVQLDKARCVYEKMMDLKTTIKELVAKLEHIREQSESLGTVKNELIQVVQKLSETSEQNAAVSEEVSASTSTVGADIDNLNSSLASITSICDDLKGIVEYFG